MPDIQITENKIYEILGKHLCGELKDHKGPIPGAYSMSWSAGEEVCVAYPSNGFDHVGATRTIVISKKTGKILADLMVGE